MFAFMGLAPFSPRATLMRSMSFGFVDVVAGVRSSQPDNFDRTSFNGRCFGM
jgi:hypothetical protein